jgi:hypothetical protein
MNVSRTNITPRTHPALRAACADLDRAGLKYESDGEHHLTVDGRFLFWPVTGFWRALDRSSQGYNVRNLIAAARANKSGDVLAFPREGAR